MGWVDDHRAAAALGWGFHAGREWPDRVGGKPGAARMEWSGVREFKPPEASLQQDVKWVLAGSAPGSVQALLQPSQG